MRPSHNKSVSLESPLPTLEWMNKVVDTITPRHLKKRLEEEREVDFSYYQPGIGRFRTNLLPAAARTGCKTGG